MPEIKIGALGGLGEIGKNLYLVEVDEKIFVLDCGIKVPSSEFFGIDTIIPDYHYLKENVDRVQGIFLTHAHDDHINALVYMIDDINKDVYASNFTMALVKDSIQLEHRNPDNYKLHTVTEDEEKQGLDEIQKMTDKFIKDIDEILAKREKDILEI